MVVVHRGRLADLVRRLVSDHLRVSALQMALARPKALARKNDAIASPGMMSGDPMNSAVVSVAAEDAQWGVVDRA